MRAWAYSQRGTPDQVLKLRHDLPQPQPTDLKIGEILIKVSHVALFAPTVKIMILKPHFSDHPQYPEYLFSGTVAATTTSASGSPIGRFQPGDAVFGAVNPKQMKNHNGVLAEYAIMLESAVLHRPPHLKPEEAAGLCGAGCTNIQFAELSGLLRIERSPDGKSEHVVSTGKGKRVLVTAGSSGTGIVMVQLAKMLVGKDGLVVATCSERNAQTVKDLGADEVIDYTKHQDLPAYLASRYSAERFDVIVDIAGADSHLFNKSPSYLNEDGTFIFAGNIPVTFRKIKNINLAGLTFIYQVLAWLLWIWINSIWPAFLGGVPRRGTFHSGNLDERTLGLLGQLVEDGKITGVTDSVWKMEDALKIICFCCFHSKTTHVSKLVHIGNLVVLMRRMVLAAVGQICSTSSMSHNLAQCQTLIKKAAEAGAKTLFLPEASDYIATSSDETLSLAQPVSSSPFVLGLQKLAKQHHISINVGLHEPTIPPSSRILNTLLWIDESGSLLEKMRYTKLHLFNLDLSDSTPPGPVMKESNTTQPGNAIIPPYDSPIGKVGSQICFDLRFPEPAIALRRMGAQILVYPSAFTVLTGKMGHWEVLLRAQAVLNQCWVIASAQCGRHNGKRVSYGDSLVVDPKGKIVGRLSRVENAEDEKMSAREPELLVVEIDLAQVKSARRNIPLERRTDVYPKI